MGKITEVSDANFEAEVLRSNLPVLVDFWAPWCGPCKAIAPIVEELAAEYDGKLKVAKLNVDNNPGTASRYGVRGIPTLLILKGGTVKDQVVGAVAKAKLVQAIGNVLGS
ncbi:MAG TPA: thioredoxin [Candidatus Binatia bacterium]|jgi:thioredoxin 1